MGNETNERNGGWRENRRAFGIIAGATLVVNFMVYLPFLQGMNLVGQYWDGPLYIYIAKTLYAIPADHPFSGHPDYLPARYFGAHLILFPLTIKIFATVAGYTMGTVLAVYSATVLFGFVFYLYCRELGFVSRPLALSVVLLVLHPRWLLYHAVGASEPLFLLLVFSSLLLYRRGSHKTAFVAAGLAAVTRIFGILLLPYYVILLVWNKQYRSLAWTLAIPIPLLMLFGYYHLQFGDFLAYFKTNSKLITPPLEMLTQKSSAEHPHFAEYFILMSGLVALAVTAVYRQARELWLYAVIFAAPLLFISHPDISRYSLPLLPVAAIAWHAPLTERKYWIALGLAVCLEYLYVWRAIPMNIAPEIIYLEVAR